MDGQDDAADVDGALRERAVVPRSPRWHPTTKIIAGIGLALAGLTGLYLARNALALVALSGLIAFLVAPLIRLLERRAGFPRVLALLTSYLALFVAVVLVSGLIIGGIVNSFSEIDPAEAADSLRGNAIDWLTAVRTVEIAGFELDFSETVDRTIERLEENDALEAVDEAANGPGDGTAVEGGEGDGDASTIRVDADLVDRLLGGLVTSAQSIGGLLVAALVTSLIALYLSADSRRFHDGLFSQVPAGYEDDATRVSERIGTVWRGYLYGQLANSLATGILVWLVLWAVGLPGAFVFGLIMVLLNMIPTFGPIIAAVPGVLAALALGSTRFDWPTLTFALLVVGIYVVVVQLQANVMAPFITGQAVRMAPATILIGLIVGFQVGGLVGSLLVVPVLATFKELGKYVLAKLLDRDPFADDEPALEPEDADAERSEATSRAS